MVVGKTKWSNETVVNDGSHLNQARKGMEVVAREVLNRWTVLMNEQKFPINELCNFTVDVSPITNVMILAE